MKANLRNSFWFPRAARRRRYKPSCPSNGQLSEGTDFELSPISSQGRDNDHDGTAAAHYLNSSFLSRNVVSGNRPQRIAILYMCPIPIFFFIERSGLTGAVEVA